MESSGVMSATSVPAANECDFSLWARGRQQGLLCYLPHNQEWPTSVIQIKIPNTNCVLGKYGPSGHKISHKNSNMWLSSLKPSFWKNYAEARTMLALG